MIEVRESSLTPSTALGATLSALSRPARAAWCHGQRDGRWFVDGFVSGEGTPIAGIGYVVGGNTVDTQVTGVAILNAEKRAKPGKVTCRGVGPTPCQRSAAS